MRHYRPLLQYARRQRLFLFVVPLLTVAASLLAALQPWPLKLLADQVLGQAPVPDFLRSIFAFLSLEPSPAPMLLLVVFGGLALFALNSALEVLLTWAWTLAGRRMVFDLAEDLFARMQRRSLAFHRRNAVGDLLARVTGDSWAVHQVVDTLLFAPAYALLTIGAMVFLMWQLDVRLTFLSLAAAPFMFAVSLFVGKRIRAAAQQKRHVEVQLQSHIQQTLSGIPVVQAFAQEEREEGRFQQFADAVVRAQQRTTFVASVNTLLSGLVITLGAGLVLWVGTRSAVDGRVTIGSLLVFLGYLTTLQTQMKVFAGIYTSLQGFRASVDRVNEILAAPPEVEDKPGAPPLPPVRGHVRFENVTFGYEKDRPVLHELSLEAQPGQILALVGPTGAGKTTLISLIPRFFDPCEGRVVIDGHDLRDVRLQSIREQVSLVLQEPFLFPVSVAENIAYGRPDASQARIEAVARAANAHDFITRLPQGYQTVLGERGGTLSGGERQRLSIARALLKDAPILILDEPTSALDAETESLFLQALERLIKGRTTFLIAHRLSTVRRADRVVFLQGGRIAESGTHDELLAHGGPYAHFHSLQFQPQKKPAPLTA